MDWKTTIYSAQESVQTLETAIAELTKFRDASALEIGKYLRVREMPFIERTWTASGMTQKALF